MPVEHLTDTDFKRVCAYVSRRYGLAMEEKRVLLECRLSHERERLGLPSFAAYLNLVESGANSEAHRRFVDLVTTHYSYFMRESSQFAFLRDVAFPELQHRSPHRPWSILSAGCSTGEECYTVSMLYEDYALCNPAPGARIRGIDVSEAVLAEARRGVYPEARIAKVPKSWKRRYFAREGDAYAVTDRVRGRVSFLCGNLNEENGLNGHHDVILCRNTIIYLKPEPRKRLVERLHAHLARDGWLVLGHAEIISDRTRFAYQGDSIYRKQEELATT